MKHLPLALSALTALSLAACAPVVVDNDNDNTASSSSASSWMTTENENVTVNIAPGDTVTSPLTVTGEASGWYFEASFPVRLLDGNGNEIAVAPAQAQDDWMTTDFVPYSATLTFTTPATATGTLVLEKDNPSGEPANAESVMIPVTF
jgi:ABC-type Fe3+-hydroxamate transport system substrate-binding protein